MWQSEFTGWDFSEKVQKSANLLWDTNALAWVKATGSATAGTNVNVNNFPASFGATQLGTWTVGITPLTTVSSGKQTVTSAGTRVQLTSGACSSVTVKALAANAGLIYVGGSAVAAANGFQLSGGDSVSMDVNNVGDVYIDSATNSDGVSWVAVA